MILNNRNSFRPHERASLVRVWRAAADATAARTTLTCCWLHAELVELNLQPRDRDAERAVEGSVRR